MNYAVGAFLPFGGSEASMPSQPIGFRKVEEYAMKKTVINPDSIVSPPSKYSHAIHIDMGDAALIFVAGQTATDIDGNLLGKNDIGTQTRFVFEQIKTILESGGASLSDVVKVNIYVTDVSLFPQVAEVRNRYLADNPPASTCVEVTKLLQEGCMIEIEVIAAVQK